MYNRTVVVRRWGEGEMPSLEERVAYLEGRFDDHAGAIDHLRNGMAEGRGDLRNGLTDVRNEIAHLRTDLQTEISGLRTELHGEIGGLRNEVADLRSVTERHFTWLVGIQMAGLVAVIGAFVGSHYR
jgi:hypothetical protein